MTNQPGGGETQTATVATQTQDPVHDVAGDNINRNGPAPLQATNGKQETIPTVEKTFSKKMNDIADAYKNLVLDHFPPASDIDPQDITLDYNPHIGEEQFARMSEGFQKWLNEYYIPYKNESDQLPETIPTGSLVRVLSRNINHDLSNFMIPLRNAFDVNNDPEIREMLLPWLNPYFLNFPEHIFRCSARQYAEKPEMTNFNPATVARSIQGFFTTLMLLASEKPLQLTVDRDKDISLFGDPLYLERLLDNLCSNAYKVFKDRTSGLNDTDRKITDGRRPKIMISIKNHPEDPNRLVVSVVDNSNGFDPDLKELGKDGKPKAVEEGVSRRKGGSGQGLKIVDRLSSIFDGKISIDNKPFPNTDEMGSVVSISMAKKPQPQALPLAA